jgi:hypothetical protein
MSAIQCIFQVRGYDANGNAVVFEGTSANRVIEFSPHMATVRDTSATPHRIRVSPSPSALALETRVATLEAQVAALEAQVAALAPLAAQVAAIEAMLAGNGEITADRLVVREIEAKGTGLPPSEAVGDLSIVTRTPTPGVYDEVVRIVGVNNADINPATKVSFFGLSAVQKQPVTATPSATDLKLALEAFGLVKEI